MSLLRVAREGALLGLAGAFLLTFSPAAPAGGLCYRFMHCPGPYVFCEEGPPWIKIKCACPRPVCDPCNLEHFGYYRTCWQPWPYGPNWSHCAVPPPAVVFEESSHLPPAPPRGLVPPPNPLPPANKSTPLPTPKKVESSPGAQADQSLLLPAPHKLLSNPAVQADQSIPLPAPRKVPSSPAVHLGDSPSPTTLPPPGVVLQSSASLSPSSAYAPALPPLNLSIPQGARSDNWRASPHSLD